MWLSPKYSHGDGDSAVWNDFDVFSKVIDSEEDDDHKSLDVYGL